MGRPLELQPGRTASNDQRLTGKVMATAVDGNFGRLSGGKPALVDSCVREGSGRVLAVATRCGLSAVP